MTHKICIISTVDITLKQFVIPSARLMKAKGFNVTLFASMSDRFISEFSDEFNLINIQMERGAKPIGMIKGIVSFLKFFNREQFDIIQYATPNAAFYAAIAGWLCRTPARIYCQWGIRYVGFSGVQRMVFRMIEKVTCRLSTHIRPASKKNMEFAITENLYKSKEAKVIGDGGAVGIDLDVFDISKRDTYKEEILERYPHLRDRVVFGFVGRLDKDKGINELLEAFKLLNNEYSNTALFIIGPKENQNGIKIGLFNYCIGNDNIIFTDFTNEVPKYLSVLSILVHPSYREGFSLVIQQAMAMGVPVITTNIPGPSEVIEENVSGVLVPAKDSQSLYLAMKELAFDQKKQVLFGTNGLERVKKLFTQERMSQLILEDRQKIFESVS